jgi:hypothetical protein
VGLSSAPHRKGKMKTIKQKFVLDESGSMDNQQDTVISGFNEQIITMKKEEKEQGVRYLVSLTKFNEHVELMYKDLPLANVPLLTKETYNPSGWTALYDAIGATIDTAKLGETDTIVTIMTDGVENRSKKWKKAGIKALIDVRQNENKWGFVYFGANQDAWAEASSLGMKNAMNYSMTSTGTAMNSMSSARCCYTTTAMNNTYDVSNLTANINQEDLLK